MNNCTISQASVDEGHAFSYLCLVKELRASYALLHLGAAYPKIPLDHFGGRLVADYECGSPKPDAGCCTSATHQEN